MKYIRTKDGIYIPCKIDGYKDYYCLKGNMNVSRIEELNVLNQSDIIYEICDYCVYYNAYKDLVFRKLPLSTSFASLYRDLQKGYINDVKLGILTDKGLIFVARMNERGELELI